MTNPEENNNPLPDSEGSVLRERWSQKDETGQTKQETLIKALRLGKETDSIKTVDTKDFRYIDLTDENLSGLDFSEADFTGAILKHANFSQCNLSKANLYKADIEKCEFLGANLKDATINESHADFAGFGNADLTNANLFHSSLIGATFTRSNLSKADVRAVNLEDSRIRDANLEGAIFTKADLKNADLEGSNVEGVSFNDVDFQDAKLKSLKNYQKASWIGSNIRNVDFHGAYLIRRFIMDENFLHEFRTQSKTHEILYKVWLVTSDCGRSFTRWAIFVGTMTILFGFLYTFVDINYGVHGDSWFAPYYFSVITITTLGYGDITPISTAAEILSVLEVTVGYCSLGGLLSLFATKMSRRAD